MLTINFVREHHEEIRRNAEKKGRDPSLVDQVLKIDETWRSAQHDVETIRKERNSVSQAINLGKKKKEDVSDLIAKAKTIPNRLKTAEEKTKKLYDARAETLLKLPNMMHPDVPVGKDESENVVRKTWGKPKSSAKVTHHVEIAEQLKVADFEASGKVSGSGFYYLIGDLALLNQALIRFTIDFLAKKEYTYVEPPLMVRRKIVDGVMSFQEMDDMIYKIEGEDLYLIGTSEHSLIGMYTDTTIPKEHLPVKLASYSACFRKEIGSHGIDEKGLWRTHQFNKVEQVIICTPEQSWELFDELLRNTEEIMQALDLPYRVVEMCTGDLGDLKSRQYDIEVWRPTTKDYGETMSCSNLTGAQAARLGIRYVDKKGERDFCHTLNNTAIATSRILVAILENNQQKDGSVTIPPVLQSYLFGKKSITLGCLP